MSRDGHRRRLGADAACAALLCAWLCLAPGAARAAPLDDANAGLEALKRGDPAAAVQLFSRALDSGRLSQGDQELAYVKRGEAQLAAGRADDALADARRALAIDGTDQEAAQLQADAARQIEGRQKDAALRRELGNGLALSDRTFAFGANYRAVNGALPTPFAVNYAGMPRAGEYGAEDIRYFWVTTSQIASLQGFFQAHGGGGRCIDPQSYITLFFKDEVFFHISLRLHKTRACPSYDWLRQDLFGAGSHGAVAEPAHTTDLTFHDGPDFAVLEITRLGVANASASVWNQAQ